MATDRKSDGKEGAGKDRDKTEADKAKAPDWAGGLKQLYDSVVEEPLPDSFRDLLSKLDESESSDGAGTA
ncbi:MAG: NepR family anti-sigma factor [Pseudomonadota bacterium]